MRNDSVIKAFAIVEYMAKHEKWVSTRSMARDLDLPPAVVHRYLTTLKDIGYIQKQPEDGRYSLTLKFAWIASQIFDKLELRQVAQPRMNRLAELLNETIHLAQLEGNEMVYIEKVDNKQAMNMRSRVGGRAPIYSTAVGKAVLAYLPEDEALSLLKSTSLTPLTKNTITDLDKLIDNLHEIKQRGYSIDDEENEIGIRCIGAPIFDHEGRIVAALSVSGWIITMDYKRVEEAAPILMNVCRELSEDLGFTQ